MPTTGSPVRASTPRSLSGAGLWQAWALRVAPSSVVPVMTTTPRTTLRDHIRSSWRILLKEITAFGFIGAIAFAIDLGIFAWLSHYGALKANFVSTVASTAFAYVGNRYLSFSHRARSS